MTMKHETLAVAALALSVGASSVSAQTMDRLGWLVLKEPAAEFELKDLNGKVLRSADVAGHVVVIDFWATWCGPCIKELPDLAQLHEAYHDSDNVLFLSAAVTEDAQTVSAFAKKKQISYPIYLADDLLGPYNVYVFPTKLIIDARDGAPGVVRFRREGYTPLSAIEAKLAELNVH